jgi:hypothetical protein
MWKMMEIDMPDNEQKKIDAERRQISILRSGNITAILATIHEVRTMGNSSLLPEIFDLLLVSENEEVRNACSGLLNDLKPDESAGYLVSALKSEKYKPVRNILVSACWQNGLDYHEDVLLFADLLIYDTYTVALEAFTVIENSLGAMEERDIVRLSGKLKLGLKSADENKKRLINELLSVIMSY